MKNSIIALFAITLFACGGSAPETQEKVCTLSIDPTSVKVNWTAFKTSTKVAVGGTFDSISVSGLKEGDALVDVLTGAAVNITTSSVNSSNVSRDEKVVANFFGTMINGGVITASIKEVDSLGGITLAINLNGIDQVIPVTTTQSGDILTLSGMIDMNDFGAIESIKSLNKVCELLHSGENGESILWPQVAISVSAIVTKNCK